MIIFVIHVPQVLQKLTMTRNRHWNFVFERYCTVFVVHFNHVFNHNPTTYFFKSNDRNTGTMCEICSKLTIKTPERRHDVALVASLLTLNRQIIP